MRLDEYMREHRLTQAALGARLVPPVTQSQVSQWFRGITRITLEQALQIQVLSGGLVTPADCADVRRTDSESTTQAAA
ncbi:helix-turn-helix domain-containing protein [Paraburkholderia caballeronis]|uniref:helix-turn-helix domain-containing protein n=1 Tax=Paraburkholderia caballeronis TaxID=416943 RepID=UPI001066D2AA|nr:helix-turn-helix domain-containing protein [Paraburkholderia caballeronis]TDV06038.1 helix-turn-helix protein [Paraburkholderia caballeronis]TDV09578.1 helix-turn-helix protein [Paraburkholderia caballeronis]TDV21643.1 helix-turn-helix protein [Paraburkholderia caballeronis]